MAPHAQNHSYRGLYLPATGQGKVSSAFPTDGAGAGRGRAGVVAGAGRGTCIWLPHLL